MTSYPIGVPPVTGKTNAGRETQPYQYPYGVIPRRVVGTGGGHSIEGGQEGFWKFAADSPLRLLSLLPDIHPSVGLALWNTLRLTCGEGDTQIIAVTPGTPKKGEIVDVEGTAAIEALWESLPEEIGGLVGLMSQLTQQAMLTGLVCAEAEPGPSMTGVHCVWPVDSLTIFFHRDFKTTRILPLQRQLFIKKPKETYQGYAVLSRDTFFWRTMDAVIDDPYGRAPFAVAAFECLCDLAMIQDLRDAIHNGAWPRLALGSNFQELYKIATETMGLKDNSGDFAATNWVNARIQDTVEAVSKLKASDNLFYDAAGNLKILESTGAFRALEPVIEYLRQRLVQSLKSLPTLMGINDGSTQTYTTVEWAIYSAGLESVRNIVVNVLCRCAQLHLQLLGLPLKAVAKVSKIRTTDGMIEAQAESIRIENEARKVQLGWVSNDEASITITGSGPVGPAMPGALESKSGGGTPGTAPPENQGGKTDKAKKQDSKTRPQEDDSDNPADDDQTSSDPKP